MKGRRLIFFWLLCYAAGFFIYRNHLFPHYRGSDSGFEDYISDKKNKNCRNDFILRAKVVKVFDGDSLEIEPDRSNSQYESLESREGFRMVGIDAYEMTSDNEREKLLAFWQRDFAYYSLNNKQVGLEIESSLDGSLKRDHYHRLLGYVYLEDNEIYQVRALRRGMVKGFYKYNFKEKYMKIFSRAEKTAREEKRGVFCYPPREIDLKAVPQYVGDIVSVKLKVYRVSFGKEYVFFDSARNFRQTFSAVIPKKYLANFSGKNYQEYFLKFNQKWISIRGFLGIYKNKVQMRIYFPSQLQLVN